MLPFSTLRLCMPTMYFRIAAGHGFSISRWRAGGSRASSRRRYSESLGDFPQKAWYADSCLRTYLQHVFRYEYLARFRSTVSKCLRMAISTLLVQTSKMSRFQSTSFANAICTTDCVSVLCNLIDHFVASSFRHFTRFIHSWFASWGDTLDEKRFQIPHNRRKDLT